jgi:hypothetical protein
MTILPAGKSLLKQRFRWLGRTLAVQVGLAAWIGLLQAADDPSPEPVISSYAPAKDLIAQAKAYVTEIEEVMASSADFQGLSSKVIKNAATLAVIGQALALHDEPHELKAAAASMIRASQDLQTEEDYEKAKAALARLQTAARGEGQPDSTAPEGWSDVSELGPLMKQALLLQSRLERNTQGRRLKSEREDTTSMAAVLAVVGQGTAYDDDPDADRAEWRQFSEQMRDTSAETAAAIRAEDAEGVKKALARLDQSCKSCHRTFRGPQ